MKLHKELIGAGSHILILSVLAGEPSYGYQIIKRINDEAGGRFVWQEGTVYPLLHKLEKDGLIKAQWQSTDTGRRRKYYHITEAGQVALEHSIQEWMTFHGVVSRLVEETAT